MPTGVFIPTEPGHSEKVRAALQALDLTRFINGQAEDHLEGGILNGGKVFRGDLAAIAIEGDELVLRFAWLGVMSTPGRWKNDPELEMRFGLLLVASCEQDAQGRVILQLPIVDQMLVLFPPDYTVDGEPRRLERSDVVGA